MRDCDDPVDMMGDSTREITELLARRRELVAALAELDRAIGDAEGRHDLAEASPAPSNAELHQLRHNERLFHAVLANAKPIMFALDRSGRFTLSEGRGLASLGLAPGQVVGHSAFELYAELPVVLDGIKSALRGETFENVVALGSTTFEFFMSPLYDGERIDGVVGMGVDISGRLDAEASLRHSEHLLSTTLASIGDAVITTDVEGNITFVNPVASRLTGWSANEASGRHLDDVFRVHREETGERLESPVARVVREGCAGGLANHTILRARNGFERPIADTGAPIADDDGATLGVVLVFRDVTDSRDRDARLLQHQKLEAVGTLAAGVAHEINNPLTGIMNFGELIRRDAGEGTTLAKYAVGIVEESERIAGVIRDVLAFARQEGEAHSPAHIADIVRSALTLSRSMLRRDQIELAVDIPEGMPQLKCRSQQIQQVLLNLINNARDALNLRYPTYHEDKQLNIHVQPFEYEGARWMRTTVRDHGNGVPQGVLERVFDPFFTTKPRDRGTGLGLSVSRGIIEDHHGRIRLQTELNVGTSAIIELRVDNGWSLEPSRKHGI